MRHHTPEEKNPKHFSLFCTLTNKCTIISQIITLLHVSTLPCLPQGACNQYLAKLHKYVTYKMWNNFNLHYQQMHLKYLRNLARYWLQAPWRWHNSVKTCRRSVIICEIIVQLLVTVQNNKRCTVHGIKIIFNTVSVQLTVGKRSNRCCVAACKQITKRPFSMSCGWIHVT